MKFNVYWGLDQEPLGTIEIDPIMGSGKLLKKFVIRPCKYCKKTTKQKITPIFSEIEYYCQDCSYCWREPKKD